MDEQKLNNDDPVLTADPSQVQEMRKGRLIGIRRMNALSTIILIVVLGLAMGVWYMSSGQRSFGSKDDESKTAQAEVNPNLADEVLRTDGREAGIMKPDEAPELPPTFEVQGQGLSVPVQATPEPVPQQVVQVVEAPEQPSEEEMLRRQQEQQLLQERFSTFSQAVASPTGVSVDQEYKDPRIISSASDRTPLSSTIRGMEAVKDEYEQKLATAREQLQAIESGDYSGDGFGGNTGAFSATSGSSLSRNPNNNAWSLKSNLIPPKPYEVSTGFVIPATMITGINSDLPSSIQAQVSQNIYDTATGKYLLIPQGTKIVGVYSNNVAFGQSRVLVAWNRLIFPDGRKIDIGDMGGTTPDGYAGFADKVNNHYFRLFGSAFLMSAITAGVTWSQDRNNNDNDNSTSASQAMSEALGQQLGQVTAQLISKNLNVSPTIEIRPGFRFNVIVTKDISFDEPYKAFHY